MDTEFEFALESMKRSFDALKDEDRCHCAKRLAELFWKEREHSLKLSNHCQRLELSVLFWKGMAILFLSALIIEAWV